ncbi:FkbM family methyltransferase [Pontivivens ytuae]|uniref:FkbM family methyltransferase n=1 Tax=Pontivivens ytuae TaxID=2789856 RepID=A0A7S9LT64_9RHOB|nr:FkbM family methyltransferase [Pontivivens ytuae]QPH54826.1 FkbM family methyltransferase [Pontivivens ytuae]
MRAFRHCSLAGGDAAATASELAALLGGAPIEYDSETGDYVCRDTVPQRILRPERLEHIIAGTASRARTIGSEYHLDHVPLADGDRVVDVGANIGDFGLTLVHRQVAVDLTCFEPSPAEFATLERNLASFSTLAGARAQRVALWSERTDGLKFYVKSGSADSSLVPISGADEEITVPTDTLDNLLDDAPYKLLKLEAEGAEPEILEGARRVIGQFAFVAADVGFERGVRQESTLPQVANFLYSHGFEIVANGRRRHVILFRNTEVSP